MTLYRVRGYSPARQGVTPEAASQGTGKDFISKATLGGLSLALLTACSAVAQGMSPTDTVALPATPEPTPTSPEPKVTPSPESLTSNSSTNTEAKPPGLDFPGLNYGSYKNPDGSVSIVGAIPGDVIESKNPDYQVPVTDGVHESEVNILYSLENPNAVAAFRVDQNWLMQIFQAEQAKDGSIKGKTQDGIEVEYWVQGNVWRQKAANGSWLIFNPYVVNTAGKPFGTPAVVYKGNQLMVGLVDNEGNLVEGSAFENAFIPASTIARRAGFDPKLAGVPFNEIAMVGIDQNGRLTFYRNKPQAITSRARYTTAQLELIRGRVSREEWIAFAQENGIFQQESADNLEVVARIRYLPTKLENGTKPQTEYYIHIPGLRSEVPRPSETVTTSAITEYVQAMHRDTQGNVTFPEGLTMESEVARITAELEKNTMMLTDANGNTFLVAATAPAEGETTGTPLLIAEMNPETREWNWAQITLRFGEKTGTEIGTTVDGSETYSDPRYNERAKEFSLLNPSGSTAPKTIDVWDGLRFASRYSILARDNRISFRPGHFFYRNFHQESPYRDLNDASADKIEKWMNDRADLLLSDIPFMDSIIFANEPVAVYNGKQYWVIDDNPYYKAYGKSWPIEAYSLIYQKLIDRGLTPGEDVRLIINLPYEPPEWGYNPEFTIRFVSQLKADLKTRFGEDVPLDIGIQFHLRDVPTNQVSWGGPHVNQLNSKDLVDFFTRLGEIGDVHITELSVRGVKDPELRRGGVNLLVDAAIKGHVKDIVFWEVFKENGFLFDGSFRANPDYYLLLQTLLANLAN